MYKFGTKSDKLLSFDSAIQIFLDIFFASKIHLTWFLLERMNSSTNKNDDKRQNGDNSAIEESVS